MLPKTSELVNLAKTVRPATISICEIWLDHTVNDSEIAFPDYHVVRKDRNRNGGRVCIYIRSDLAFNLRQDINNPTLEAVWVEILLPKTKPILVSLIYRPPSQRDFIDVFDRVLKDIDPEQETYILGDTNICTRNKRSSLYKDYTRLLRLNGYSQIISEPTRIANISSVIDHIICSSTEKSLAIRGLTDRFE